MDADLSTDFEDMKSLVTTLKHSKNLDFVYGSRCSAGGEIERNPLRKIVSKIIKSLIYIILKLPIKDTQCGAKVFKRSIIPTAYKSPFVSRWLFDVEIFVRLKNFYGSKQKTLVNTYEQSLKKWIHVDDSKLGIKDSIKIPFKLVSIWFTYSIVQQFERKYLASKDIITTSLTDNILKAPTYTTI